MPSPSEHVTLTANTVSTVTLDRAYDVVEVIARDDDTNEVYYLINPGATNPTIGGSGTEVLLGGKNASEIDVFTPIGAAVTVVKLISAGARKVSVIGR